VTVYTDAMLPKITNQTMFKDVEYIDRHPQPSHDHTTLPDLVKRFYGNLTAANVAQYIPRLTQVKST